MRRRILSMSAEQEKKLVAKITELRPNYLVREIYGILLTNGLIPLHCSELALYRFMNTYRIYKPKRMKQKRPKHKPKPMTVDVEVERVKLNPLQRANAWKEFQGNWSDFKRYEKSLTFPSQGEL